jgi:hypothetical protein
MILLMATFIYIQIYSFAASLSAQKKEEENWQGNFNI